MIRRGLLRIKPKREYERFPERKKGWEIKRVKVKLPFLEVGFKKAPKALKA